MCFYGETSGDSGELGISAGEGDELGDFFAGGYGPEADGAVVGSRNYLFVI